jgi:hypothetical protein
VEAAVAVVSGVVTAFRGAALGGGGRCLQDRPDNPRVAAAMAASLLALAPVTFGRLRGLSGGWRGRRYQRLAARAVLWLAR